MLRSVQDVLRSGCKLGDFRLDYVAFHPFARFVVKLGEH